LTARTFHPSRCREESYPVLAAVSSCYSRVKGRLLTCYSPVRHSSHPRRDACVRLACVKHAASVRPEPGSNSPLKNIDYSSALFRRRNRLIGESTSLNTDRTHCWVLLLINLKGIRLGCAKSLRTVWSGVLRQPSTGSLVHLLALTFSTLLSSQVSGAHRAGGFSTGLGQLDQHYEVWSAESNRHFVPPPARQTPAEIPVPSECYSVSASIPTDRWPVGFLRVGHSSPASACPAPWLFCCVLRPVEACRTLRLCDSPVNPVSGARCHTTLDGRVRARQGRSMISAPTVRLPRRTMTYRPCNRSAGVSRACGSLTLALLR
jgi:hypothetical protein